MGSAVMIYDIFDAIEFVALWVLRITFVMLSFMAACAAMVIFKMIELADELAPVVCDARDVVVWIWEETVQMARKACMFCGELIRDESNGKFVGYCMKHGKWIVDTIKGCEKRGSEIIMWSADAILPPDVRRSHQTASGCVPYNLFRLINKIKN